MQRYRLPRFHDLIFIVILVGGFVLGARMLNTDSDLGRHLTLGSYILQSGHVPTRDILSSTRAGLARPPYEWLAQVLFAAAYRLADLDGVVLLTSLVIAAAFAVVFTDAAGRSHAPVLSLFITGWAAAASSLHWLSRPHVFSFLLLAIWLLMLERLRRGEPQPLWAFPLVMLVWANTHGGFLFGFLAYGAYLAGWLLEGPRHTDDGWTAQKLLFVGVLSLATSSITPDLWHNWDAVLGNRSAYVLSRTVETMPLNLALPNAWPFLGLLILSALLLLLRPRHVAPAHVLLLAGLAAASLFMGRNVPLFAIAAAPLCSEWLAGLLQRFGYWLQLETALTRIDLALRGFAWSALTVLMAVGLLAFHRAAVHAPFYQFSPGGFPVAAVDWTQQHPLSGNMFNDSNWGGYLLFRMWPQKRVFIDSQSDFYGEAFVRQYLSILDGTPGWDMMLAQYHVGWMIVSPSTPLAAQARDSGRWQVAYEDGTAIVLVRR